MHQDEVIRSLRNTYENDIFRYRGNAFSKICKWVDKFQPDSIGYYEQLLQLIKDDETKEESKKLAKKDSANGNGRYMPLSINTKKYLVIFFEKIYRNDTNLSEIAYYDIYDVKIIDKQFT